MANEVPTLDLTKMYEPIQKLIDLNLNKFQETVANHSEATKSFVEQTDARIKAAAEIKDFDALAAFMKEQSEIVQSNLERLVAESKAATEEVVAYGNEVQHIMSECMSSVDSPAKPKRKAPAKK